MKDWTEIFHNNDKKCLEVRVDETSAKLKTFALKYKVCVYAKYLWDSDFDMGPDDIEDLKDYSESIRILKTLPGHRYVFWVDDWGSAEYGLTYDFWESSGMKAYLFRGTTLLKTFTPPPGSVGKYWDICEIAGTTITPINDVYGGIF